MGAAPLQLHELGGVHSHRLLDLCRLGVIANGHGLRVIVLEDVVVALNRLDGVLHELQVGVLRLVFGLRSRLKGQFGPFLGLNSGLTLPFKLRFQLLNALFGLNCLNFRLFGLVIGLYDFNFFNFVVFRRIFDV